MFDYTIQFIDKLQIRMRFRSKNLVMVTKNNNDAQHVCNVRRFCCMPLNVLTDPRYYVFQSFTTLVNNALRVAAINSVGDFILFLGKIGVMAATAAVGILWFKVRCQEI